MERRWPKGTNGMHKILRNDIHECFAESCGVQQSFVGFRGKHLPSRIEKVLTYGIVTFK